MPESTGTEAGRRSLADKLNYLFTIVRPPDDDREYTGREVVAAITAAGGEISASHLSELRRGLKTNPTVRVLEGLAQFFQVRVAYFLDDPKATEEVEAELELHKAMRDAQVRDVALRVAGLAPSQRSAMYRLLAEIIRENDDR
jgi:transcriptional regulator with XRE-family HTH domain